MTARRRRARDITLAVVVVVVAVIGTVLVVTRPDGVRGTAAPATEALASEGPFAADDPAGPSGSVSPSASASASASPSAAARTATATSTPRPAANNASRLRTLPAATRQVIVVSGDGFGSSTAVLEAFAKVNGVWQPAFGAMSARVGSAGFADNKVEGDLKTPTGVYPIGGTMYGIAASPGVRYAYHRLVPDDYWNENPATGGYNSFEHGPNPGGASEALWQISPQYTHFAVINYNIPVVKADPPRGSGIFLHQSVPGRATAGCVAVSNADLVAILRWLDPAASPRIVMAPKSALGRY